MPPSDKKAGVRKEGNGISRKFTTLKTHVETESAIEAPKSGIFIFPDGSRYEGEYKEPDVTGGQGGYVRHGQGKFIANSGGVYTGTWDTDKMHGFGVLEMPLGAKYEGLFVNNKYHGQGTYTWPDASTYSGEWEQNNLKDGECSYVDVMGQRWAGSISQGNAPQLNPVPSIWF